MAIGPLGIIAPPKLQFFVPGSLVPAAGGKVFTYAAGTTVKQATYSNDNQTPNTNPIILDANGQCVCFVDTTLKYDFTFSPSTDTDPPTAPYWTVGSIGFAEMITSFAPLNSPVFTGTPTAPNPATGDSSTNIATTQFVQQAGTLAQNNSNLTGTPTAPTASPGTLTTQIATTAFVGAEINKAPTIQWFNGTGSFTVPAGVSKIVSKVWGAGGGGGSSTATGSCGGGGGGGGFAESVLSVTPGAVIAITVGSGGTGTGTTSPGTAGGASSVGSLISAAGGSGGTSSASGIAAGGGGGAGTGTFSATGQNGASSSFQSGSNVYQAGSGGGSPFGGCGGMGGVAAGQIGCFPGGGGSGGAPTVPGTSGASGAVCIYWLSP